MKTNLLNVKIEKSFREGYLKMSNIEFALPRLLESINILQKRQASDEAGVRFLATYDLLFRSVEIKLLNLGYTYAKSPHKTFRELFSLFFQLPGSDHLSLEALSNIRHEVKKLGIVPGDQAVKSIFAYHQNSKNVLPDE